VSGRSHRYMIYFQSWRFFSPLIKEKYMLPISYLSSSTTLCCIGVVLIGLAEALHFCSSALALTDITETGGKR
jgi:hypothetical protein